MLCIMMKTTTILLHIQVATASQPRVIYKIIVHAMRLLGYEPTHKVIEPAWYGDSRINLSFVYTYCEHDFVHKVGLTEGQAAQLVAALAQHDLLEEELRLINYYAVQIITLFDEAYPAALRAIAVPPAVLYYLGAPPAGDKMLAIVGSRDADTYAHEVIHNIVPGVVAQGWLVVSGGARGVDAYAHQATVEAGGKTIVVLGSGLTHWYPRENIALFKKVIQQGGTVLSTFAMKIKPEKYNFPERNRVIAGLSQGCLIVQAAERSGALITADFALNEGRSVMAVPGSIMNTRSAGCHALLSQGARLVSGVDDVLDELGDCNAVGYHQPAAIKKKQFKNDTQHPILDFLTTAKTIDEIAVHANVALSVLQDELFVLQLDGLVTQNFAGLWERL